MSDNENESIGLRLKSNRPGCRIYRTEAGTLRFQIDSFEVSFSEQGDPAAEAACQDEDETARELARQVLLDDIQATAGRFARYMATRAIEEEGIP